MQYNLTETTFFAIPTPLMQGIENLAKQTWMGLLQVAHVDNIDA